VRALSLWRQEYGHCFDCRALHSKRSKGKKISLPRCDKTEGKECERIPSWSDSDENLRTDPPQLNKGNHLVFELYQRIMNLSPLQKFTFVRNEKQMQAYYPSMESMPFVMEYFAPKDLTIDDFDALLTKLQIIHQHKLGAITG
jgi:hypothetical protein